MTEESALYPDTLYSDQELLSQLQHFEQEYPALARQLPYVCQMRDAGEIRGALKVIDRMSDRRFSDFLEEYCNLLTDRLDQRKAERTQGTMMNNFGNAFMGNQMQNPTFRTPAEMTVIPNK